MAKNRGSPESDCWEVPDSQSVSGESAAGYEPEVCQCRHVQGGHFDPLVLDRREGRIGVSWLIAWLFTHVYTWLFDWLLISDWLNYTLNDWLLWEVVGLDQRHVLALAAVRGGRQLRVPRAVVADGRRGERRKCPVSYTKLSFPYIY